MNNTFSLIKTFKWNSLFFKYLKTLVFAVMIPFIILNVIMYFYYENISTEKSNALYSRTASNISINFSNIINEYNEIFYDISDDSDVIAFLNDDMSKRDITYSFDNIFSKLSDRIKFTPYIDSFYIYSEKSDYVLSTKSSNYLPDFYDKYWYEYIDKAKKENFIISHKNYSNKNIMTCCYELKNGSEREGYLIINTDISQLQTYLSNTVSIDNCEIFIFDDENTLVFPVCSEENEVVSPDNFTFSDEPKLQKDGDDIYCSCTIKNSNLNMITRFSETSQIDNAKIIRNNTIIWILLTVISILIISLSGSLNIYNSIAKILAVFSANGTTENETITNELEYISKNMMNSITNYEEIEKKLATQIIKLKEYQTIALQTQINPHFMFNALNSVNLFLLSKNKDEDESTFIITGLAELLEFSLNTDTLLVSLEEEVNYTKKYAEIENIMYANMIHFSWNIDYNIKKKKIIKLIFQPIIENAIKHGFRQKKQPINVIITVKQVEKNIVTTIFNDGTPIQKDKLNELNALLQSDTLLSEKHIGLTNVNQRIKLVFGTEYGLSISSTQNGTTVTIITPSI